MFFVLKTPNIDTKHDHIISLSSVYRWLSYVTHVPKMGVAKNGRGRENLKCLTIQIDRELSKILFPVEKSIWAHTANDIYITPCTTEFSSFNDYYTVHYKYKYIIVHVICYVTCTC